MTTTPDPKTVRKIAQANAVEVTQQLRAERIRQNLKQPELGLGTSVLCSWETGRAAPGLHNLTRWAATLGMEIVARRLDEISGACPLTATELAELTAAVEHLSGPDAFDEDRLEPSLIPVLRYVRQQLAVLTAGHPQDNRDVRGTCAHCARDLTGASIHTIQGIDVCADIRHCLARQSSFAERIAELDQLKAQQKPALGTAYAAGWSDAISACRTPGWAEREAGWKRFLGDVRAEDALQQTKRDGSGQ